jgi:hypothetical protein
VLAEVTTENNVHEKEKLPDLLAQIEEEMVQVSANTGYDYQTGYQAIADKEARAVIPPRRNGRVGGNGQMDDRDDNLNRIAQLGRETWKQESDYHQHSLAETGMFRLKKIFGPGLLARNLKRQQTEGRVRCVALNRMTALGMPDSYLLALA